MGLEYLLPPRPPNGDESLAAFVRRRLGREALEKIAEPLLAGIYAGSSHDMSLLATFPRLRELERHPWGAHPRCTGAASDGRQASSSRNPATTAHVHGAAGRHGRDRRGAQQPSGSRRHTAGADRAACRTARQTARLEHKAMRCISMVRRPCTPTPWSLPRPRIFTAHLVEGFHPRLAEALRAIPYVSSATISLAYRRRDVPHPLDGFGFLVGKHEGRRITAATWTSSKFPHRAPADLC